MTAQPSRAALKARRDRERRQAATPPDVRALIERGREERAELAAQAKAASAISRIEAVAAARLAAIGKARKPETRARLLGELADYIAARRDLIDRATEWRTVAPRRSRRLVPRWVPADLAAVYLDPSMSEVDAAARVRALKHQSETGDQTWRK